MKKLWRMLSGLGRAVALIAIMLLLAVLLYLGWCIEHWIYTPGPNPLFP